MTYILPNGPFTVRMDNQMVQVINIPSDEIPKAAWFIIREYCVHWRNKSYFNSILYDSDGLSLVCDPSWIDVLNSLDITNIKISPQLWIPLIINLIGSAGELPGVVFYLANSLSKEGLSILHISTFDSEVFLVQEQDIDKACDVLRSIGNLKVFSESVDKQKRHGSTDIDSSPFNVDTRSGHSSKAPLCIKDGFSLKVLPNHLLLTKLNTDSFSMQNCAPILMKLLMYDPRFSAIERLVVRRTNAKSKNLSSSGTRPLSASFTINNNNSNGSGSGINTNSGITIGGPSLNLTPGQMLKGSTNASAAGLSHGNTANSSAKSLSSFMWGVWQCGDEITFLLEEDDVSQFPPGALQIVPQQWRVIKLSGRAIDFDETGVVSAMSQVDTGIPALNISTALTNCTLVPDELLSVTLESLASTMNLPIHDDISKH